MRVLAGDIGGTKVLLQLAEFERGVYRPLAEHRFDSAAYDGLLPMVHEFQRLAGVSAPDAACFGIAGPVSAAPGGQTAQLTNLPWTVESASLSRALSIPQVRLINDFQAVGYSVEALTKQDLRVLQEGVPESGAPCAMVGAGTGLGHGILMWAKDHYEAIPSEGGHVDFAPTDDEQIELLRYLRERYGRVSYERILTGSGFVNLYNFFKARGVPTRLALKDDDSAPATITTAALAGDDPAASTALRLFVSIYGAQAGNFALSCLATGGVYIAGGIAPKILPALCDGTFLRAFLNKGRMTEVVKRIPVYIVTNPRAGLIGAALAASRLR
jgi:glucokinase